jgi:viroplasmin and RNaseH domain-containing protein
MGKPPRKVAYVVKQGRKTGIFYTWTECEEQVKGFSGQAYQGYTVLEDAERAWEKHLQDLQHVSNNASIHETPLPQRIQGMSYNQDYSILVINSFRRPKQPARQEAHIQKSSVS